VAAGFGHIEAIAADAGDGSGFIEAAKTLQWAREPKRRTPA
jgi:hypothetical protein